MARLDHIVLAVPDADSGAAFLTAATGVVPVAGGRHVGLGTMNQLTGLDGDAYLELITRDPDQDGGILADAVGMPDAPRLITWACRSHNAADVVSAAEGAGLAAHAVPMTRARGDGTVLRWTLVAIGGHPYAGAVPFFIDWHDTQHPTAMLAPSLSILSMVLESPDAAGVKAVHDALGVSIEIVDAEESNLVVTLEGPSGRVVLSGRPTDLVQALAH